MTPDDLLARYKWQEVFAGLKAQSSADDVTFKLEDSLEWPDVAPQVALDRWNDQQWYVSQPDMFEYIEGARGGKARVQCHACNTPPLTLKRARAFHEVKRHCASEMHNGNAHGWKGRPSTIIDLTQ